MFEFFGDDTGEVKWDDPNSMEFHLPDVNSEGLERGERQHKSDEGSRDCLLYHYDQLVRAYATKDRDTNIPYMAGLLGETC